jgi:putative FmdB family regulatory protein
MATYEYACAECGRFDIRATIGTAPDRHLCPVCRTVAPRAFSPPMLGQISKAWGALAGREEQSRDAPEVVTHLPAKSGRPPAAPVNPAIARLPRQ